MKKTLLSILVLTASIGAANAKASIQATNEKHTVLVINHSNAN